MSHPLAILGDLPGPKLRVLLSAALLLKQEQDVAIGLSAEVPADFHITEPEALAELRIGATHV